MKLIALSQSTGIYGTVTAGEEFEVPDELAEELLRRGNVVKALPPPVVYETKVIVPQPPTVGARPPFRHVPVPDAQPPELASASDRELRKPNVSEQGIADPGGRGRRSRFSPGS